MKKHDPVYQALWAENTDFDEVLISPVMVQDHMPDKVLDALKEVRIIYFFIYFCIYFSGFWVPPFQFNFTFIFLVYIQKISYLKNNVIWPLTRAEVD